MKATLSENHKAALTKAAIAGDQNAFVSLYQDCASQTLSLIANKFCGYDRDKAEDIIQDAVVKALQNIKSFRNECTFSTWFTTIAMNTARTSLTVMSDKIFQNASSLDKEEDGDDSPQSIIENLLASQSDSSHTNPETIIAQRQRLKALETLVAESQDITITNGYELTVMHTLDGISYADIAKKREMPIGTVRSQIHRFRQAGMAACSFNAPQVDENFHLPADEPLPTHAPRPQIQNG